MSLPSDIVAATVTEADALDLGSPEPIAGAVVASSVDPVKLIKLEMILTGVTFEEALRDATAGYRRSVDDERWLVGIRPTLTAALAAVPENDVSATAERWAATEEWLLDRGTAAALTPLLASLSELARSAQASGRRLFLLMGM